MGNNVIVSLSIIWVIPFLFMDAMVVNKLLYCFSTIILGIILRIIGMYKHLRIMLALIIG